MRRREVLAGALALPLVGGLAFAGSGAGSGAVAAGMSLLLYNRRLPRAERAADAARQAGAQTRETGGEIAALLLRERLLAGRAPVLGITGHSEYLLAADIARVAGRRVVPLMQLGRQDRWLGTAAEEPWRQVLTRFVGREGTGSPETGFAWLALPGPHS